MPKPLPLPKRFLFLSYMVTVASFLLALATFVFALMGFVNLSWAGFPDGHLTEYDRATRTLLTILLWGHLALGLYFFRLAIPDLTLRTKVVRFLITLTALILLIAFTEIAVPWYFVNYLGLDNGHGG